MGMTLTFIQAVNRFFGKKPGQSTSEFAQELKDLDEKDRAELAPLLSEVLGVDEVIVTPAKKA